VRPVAERLTAATAAQIALDVSASDSAEVVIDLSAIAEWDSAGATAMAELADGSDGRVRVRGLEEATDRMLGVGTSAPQSAAVPATIDVTRLNAVVVLRPAGGPIPTLALEAALRRLDRTVRTVVLDLAAVPTLTAGDIESLAFASSAAVLRRQELMIVNVAAGSAELLRRAGLSGHTWVASAPLDQATPES
jgi:anti-anti-sigma regulatory factor